MPTLQNRFHSQMHKRSATSKGFFDRDAEFAAQTALQAGAMLASHLPRKRHVAYKSSIDLVTEMDKASEELIFRRIRRVFPKDDILSEEGSNRATKADRLWIVDPLDGTTNYAHGIPLFSVSIALQVRGRIELGLVFAPMQNELFIARHGYGAFLVMRSLRNQVIRRLPRGAQRLRVSRVRTLGKALLVTGFPYDVRTSPGNYFKWFEAFCMDAQAVRRLGSASIDMCYIAAGRMDGFWESKLHPWDTAAAWLIVEEAGGKVTDFSGGRFDIFGTETLATNGLLHGQMKRILNKAPNHKFQISNKLEISSSKHRGAVSFGNAPENIATVSAH